MVNFTFEVQGRKIVLFKNYIYVYQVTSLLFPSERLNNGLFMLGDVDGGGGTPLRIGMKNLANLWGHPVEMPCLYTG